MVRGCFSLILKWPEGTDSICSPSVGLRPHTCHSAQRAAAPGTSAYLVTSSCPRLSDSISEALLRDGQCHGGHGQPVGGRWVGNDILRHWWFYENDASAVCFPSETVLVGAGLRRSSRRTARDRGQRARRGAFSLLPVQDPFTDEQPLTWPHHRSGSRSRPADPPRSPPRAQSWSETSASPATSQTPGTRQAGSPPK